MDTSKHIFRFISIILALLVLTVLMITINYNFFLDVDHRHNNDIVVSVGGAASAAGTKGNREYKIIYDENEYYSNHLKDNFQRVFDITKVEYSIYEVDEDVSFEENDIVILAIVGWTGHEDVIEKAMTSVVDGTKLFIGFIPAYDNYFLSKAETLGIADISGTEQSIYSHGFNIVDDILLGLVNGDSIDDNALDDELYDIKIDDETRLYLETVDNVPIYYTKQYGEGMIGVYNGQNIAERYMDGLLMGIIGSLDDYAYPIVNTGVMYIDDWPGPFRGYNEVITEQYGMNVDDFMRYVWWPDMLALGKEYDIKYIGQYVLTYNDIKKPPYDQDGVDFDTDMYAFGQQIIKYGGELGLHGYNHQPLYYEEYDEETPLNYTEWETYEDSVNALNYAVEMFKKYYPDYELNCYVPPSNIIREEGIEAVKEAMGEPVIISGMYTGDEEYLVEQHDVKYEDGVIYLPRFSSGCFIDDDMKNSIVMAMSMYGIVSHFIHPDDVMDPHRNKGKTWEEMRVEYSKLMAFVDERYPFLEYETATNGGNKVVDWYNQNYTINYYDNYIHIEAMNESDNLALILRTDKEVMESEDYELVKCSTSSYYVKLNKTDVKIMLKGQNP